MRTILSKLTFFTSLVFSTFVGVFIAFWVALFLRRLVGPWQADYSRIHFLPFLYFLFVLLVDLYRGVYVKRVPFWVEVKYTVENLFLAEILFLAFASAFKIYNISRLFLLLWFLILLLVSPVMRYLTRVLLTRFGIYRDNLLILGINDMARSGASYILKEKGMGYNIVGFVDDKVPSKYVDVAGRRFKAFKGIKRFKRIARAVDAGTIMVALPDLPGEDVIDLVNQIHLSSRKVLFMPGVKGISLLNAEIIPPFMDNILLVHLRNNLLYSRNRFLKRAMDVVLSSLGIVILSPLMLIIALLVKATSEGPVIYRQRRIGYKGRPFFVYKFRTMYKDADKRLKALLEKDPALRCEYEKKWKLKKDPRVTRIGKILRRFSLDELPQLFNVLKGEMSLVGPRPYLPEEKKQFQDVERILFMVRPGITGLWQVSGRSDTDYRFRIETDVWYVLNWSPWLDFMILAKTVWVVLSAKGAY